MSRATPVGFFLTSVSFVFCFFYFSFYIFLKKAGHSNDNQTGGCVFFCIRVNRVGRATFEYFFYVLGER